MMLPLWDGLVRTTHFDPEMAALADRHYSRRTVGARQFCYAGRKLVLRDTAGDVLFVWMWPFDEMRMDGQTGYNCAIFRNESRRLASDIIREAEDLAFAKWGPNRLYTYVDARKIRSSNPGFCFKIAGWRNAGHSARGLVLLVKAAPDEEVTRQRADAGTWGGPASAPHRSAAGSALSLGERETSVSCRHAVTLPSEAPRCICTNRPSPT